MSESGIAFIKELTQFDYSVELKDHVWDVIFPDKKGKYHYLRVTKYQEIFYIVNIDGDLAIAEISLNKNTPMNISQDFPSYRKQVRNPEAAWNHLFIDAYRWLKVVKKDWINANKKIHECYPLNRRYGIVSHSFIRTLLQDVYRIDKELGKTKTKKFIHIVEEGYFLNDKNARRETMTANDFFEYCKIAYLASQRKEEKIDASLSGKELYKRYADGRDEGLLEIDANSQQEFADWIDGKHPKKSTGGHPWEIKRGGNTTHIDLFVSRSGYYENSAFTVGLRGPAISRLKETIGMFLGIYDAKLPITIADPEKIRKRLLGQDNIGIIPAFNSLHRANQHYDEHQDVCDVMHYDDLGRYKRRIQPFITWEPLPILKPA